MECDYDDEGWQETYKSLGCAIPYEEGEKPGEPDIDTEYPAPAPLDRDNPLKPDIMSDIEADTELDMMMAVPTEMCGFEPAIAFAGR